MTLTDIGNAAGGTAPDAGAPRPRGPFLSSATAGPSAVLRPLVARPVVALGDTAADTLLEAVRRGLAPGDPVARLLAGWTAPPTRAVAVSRIVRGAGGQSEPA